MSKSLVELKTVRVVRLLRSPSQYNGWGLNRRPPVAGDLGTIVDVLHAPGSPDNYVVECSGPDGITVWLGDFVAEELELAEPGPT